MSTAEIVNQWFAETLACGAIARNTEAYNQAHDALPDLIARLDGPQVITSVTSEDPAAAIETITSTSTPPAPATGKKG